MTNLQTLLALFASLLFAWSTAASVTEPDDGPYYRLRRDRTLYIYDGAARESVEQMAAYMHALRTGYDQSFNWKLDEEQDLILTSGRQQVANAYATFSPNLKSVWYPSGGGLLEYMAESSWALALTAHETAHLYQLNAKGEVPAALKTVVGNAILVEPFWPIFVHPNILTPTFLIEGNAVFNESRANMGGRLHSGEARALVLAQIQAGDINPNRLINNQFRFPYGENPYLQGGYFQAHLATKYGVDKTNEFFLKQGNHYLWPLILNKTFREHFGASYPQEIREYTREMSALAKNQVASPIVPLSAEPFVGPLNHDANHIFYLISDGVNEPRLETFDKKTEHLERRSLDLNLGKVFWMDGHPLVAGSTQHDLHHLEYSLYGEGDSFQEKFRGQILNDIRGGKVLALDAANSWLESHVLVNGEAYDVADSQPIGDDGGNVYYFRQNGNQRVLYKNRQPIFKYDGFFGKVMEVASDGTVYFIANTDYGCTLFRFRDNEISRVLKSDRVVDARQIKDGQFLAVEVTARGHEVKIVEAELKSASPANYSYGFASYNLTPSKVRPSEQTQADERPYSSLREMRYSSLDFSSAYDSYSGLALGAALNFTDPMEYQSFSVAYLGTQFRQQNAFARYSLTKYLPKLTLSYWYQRDFWQQYNGAGRKGYNQRLDFTVAVPVWRWRHWDAALSLAPSYSREDKRLDLSAPLSTVRPDAAIEETVGIYGGAEIHYSRNSSPGLNMFPLESFDLSYLNKLQSLTDQWRKKYNSSLVQGSYEHGFPLQFYATLAGAAAWAENHDVDIVYNPYAFNPVIQVSRLTAHDEYTVQSASMGRFEFTKVFDVHGYSPRIPLGIDRLAPFVLAQGLFLDRHGAGHGDYPANIFEWGYGVDLQVLLLHLGSAKLRLLNGIDTRHPEHASQQAQLQYHLNF